MTKSQVVWTWEDFRAMEARVSALEAKDAYKDFPKIYDTQTDTKNCRIDCGRVQTSRPTFALCKVGHSPRKVKGADAPFF